MSKAGQRDGEGEGERGKMEEKEWRKGGRKKKKKKKEREERKRRIDGVLLPP